jgi:hypothetical protein
MSQMHTFKVVKEPYGWAVRLGSGMSIPFWSRAFAIQEANCLCADLRGHGESAEVVIEEIDPTDMPRVIARASARRQAVFLRSRLPGRR